MTNPCAPSACGSCSLRGLCGDEGDLPPDELPAAEWASIHRVEILDPDGWREDGLPFDAPITEWEFQRRLTVSTIRFLTPQ